MEAINEQRFGWWRCRPTWRRSGAHVRLQILIATDISLLSAGALSYLFMVFFQPCFDNDPENIRAGKDEAAEV